MDLRKKNKYETVILDFISDRLRALRAERGVTLASTGLPTSTLYNVENAVYMPTLFTLMQIAKAYDMPLSELLSGLENLVWQD